MSDNSWQSRRVLVTGVCGTVGRELLTQLLDLDVAEVVGLDTNESELFYLDEQHRGSPARFYLGDIRDADTLERHMEDVDVVLHSAAYKHVHLTEHAPRYAVQTNILGVQNIIDAALAAGVQRVVFTSSDKAVNPTSVMGTSKLMGERLLTAANALRRGPHPVFSSVRFGNVLGSRGSVIPVFQRQIAAGGPVTLTDPGMTRFIMSMSDAVRLVLDAVWLARGGEVVVTKMPVCRIEDLARVMVRELAPEHGHDAEDIPIEVVGTRPGEKLYEELLNEEEVRRTVELERYFVITPTLEAVMGDPSRDYPGSLKRPVERPYNSRNEEAMSPDELRAYLREHGLLG